MKRQARKVTYTKRHLDIRLTHPQAKIFDNLLSDYLGAYLYAYGSSRKGLALAEQILGELTESLNHIEDDKKK